MDEVQGEVNKRAEGTTDTQMSNDIDQMFSILDSYYDQLVKHIEGYEKQLEEHEANITNAWDEWLQYYKDFNQSTEMDKDFIR